MSKFEMVKCYVEFVRDYSSSVALYNIQKYSITDFLLYISCKTTFFKNIFPQSILVRF